MFPNKMGMVFVAIMGRKRKTFVGELRQIGGLLPTLLQDLARHCSTTTLGIQGHDAHLVALFNVEQWLYHAHFTLHAPPIEQVFVFGCGQMHEHTIVGLHGTNEHIGEPFAPKGKESFPLCGGQ